MVNKYRKKARIELLKKEILVKNFIIKQLLVIITKNNLKLPDSLLKAIEILYGGENGKKEEG